MSESPDVPWLLTWVRSQLDALLHDRLNGGLSLDQEVMYEELRAHERELLSLPERTLN